MNYNGSYSNLAANSLGLTCTSFTWEERKGTTRRTAPLLTSWVMGTPTGSSKDVKKDPKTAALIIEAS